MTTQGWTMPGRRAFRHAAVPIAMIATLIGAGPAMAYASLAAAGSGPPGRAGAGTIAAKASARPHATLAHPVSVPQDASGALSTVSSVDIKGGYTAAGIGMRNLGYGTITISGVPSGATVKSATLLWDVLADAADPSFAQGTFDGTAITGNPWASGTTPCWPVGANFSYQADVTSLVTGNGDYDLAGFATGESDGADPWGAGRSRRCWRAPAWS